MSEVIRTPRAKKSPLNFDEVETLVSACKGGRLGDDLYYTLQAGILSGTRYPTALWEAWKTERNFRREEAGPEIAEHAKRKKQRQRLRKEHLANVAPKLLEELKRVVKLLEENNLSALTDSARVVIEEAEYIDYRKLDKLEG